MLNHVEFRLVNLHRSLLTEKKTGIRTLTAKLQVLYEYGEFEITIKTESWSDSTEKMQSLIREPLLRFIESMRVAAEGEIVIPKPEPQ